MKRKTLRLKESLYILSIMRGLTLAIPFLIIGSFALVLNSFPSNAYQHFLSIFLGGSLTGVFTLMYNLTLGSLALILIITISFSFGNIVGNDDVFFYPVVCLCSYGAFCGGFQGQKEYIFGAEWVFTAISITLIACAMFKKGMKLRRYLERLHTVGADYIFNIAMEGLPSIAVISALFLILGTVLRHYTGGSNITNFGSYVFMRVFGEIGDNLFGILLYVFFTHLLWFFGIHGTNTLEAVSQRLFENGINVNQALLQAGKAPTEIYTKTFLDTFVFMGGCGTALCLILALFIAARKSNNRKLAMVSCTSVFFNISEVAVFGLPVIFNPAMVVPFILTPMVLVLISSFAMHVGLVPPAVNSVGWTVPIVLGGYRVTGSVAGSVLQLVNLAVGTCIYIPFVRFNERVQMEDFQAATKVMEDDMRKGELVGRTPEYLVNSYACHYYAKTLSLDLKNAVKRGSLELYYQVQMSREETIRGAEALLRWFHPIVGYVSPPLAIALAYEGGFLDEMGDYLIDKALTDMEIMEHATSTPLHVSVNVSSKQLDKDDFAERVRRIMGRHHLERSRLIIEVTERVMMDVTQELLLKFKKLNDLGIEISVDDFGMGHNSMIYLQNNVFDEVKLDGSLVRQCLNNDRSQSIISGIIQMSKTLRFDVVAEYVETEELKELLKSLGCDIFQGYYYGKAEPIEVFLERLAAKSQK